MYFNRTICSIIAIYNSLYSVKIILLYGVKYEIVFFTSVHQICGPGSLVSIVTGYELDGPGSNLGGGGIFRTCPDRPWGPPNLLYNGYRVFPGSKKRSGRDAGPSTLLVPWSRKRRTLPLLPLRVVGPVQSLSACTSVYFTFFALILRHYRKRFASGAVFLSRYKCICSLKLNQQTNTLLLPT
jgi:hypothetical protein